MTFLFENGKTRNKFLPARGKALQLPIYFPSISSVKTGLSPFQYFNILKAIQHPHFLVSAFDIDKSFNKDEFIAGLKQNQHQDGPIILMDSGNYESYWMRDKNWSIDDFNSILKQDVCDLAFCYDDQFPPADFKENAAAVAKSTTNSQGVSNSSSILPIIHSTRENIVDAVIELCKQTNCPMVSIPERILGDGLLQRIETVTKLRKELNKMENYTYIHLLGTGNPFSLMLLSFAGADSFDGLEWCQTTVNSKTAVLYHFQQREVIDDGCVFCRNSDLDYTLKTLGHNLTFYVEWMTKIQNAINKNKENDLLKQYFDAKLIAQLNKIWS